VDVKPKILIASVLKPVNDVRAYHKIGCSLAQTNKYDVNIIGFNSKKVLVNEKITTYPIYSFNRLSLKRLLAPYKFLIKAFKVKPKLLIVTTPELLQVSYLYKILFGAKLIYDIQENYYLNVKHSTAYSYAIKRMVLLKIRFTEWFSKWFVDHYFLAERIYANQLNFIRNRSYTLIENKVKTPIAYTPKFNIKLTDNQYLRFIISGTLGESYGTIEGVLFYKSFRELYPNSSLTIIGYSASHAYFKDLLKHVHNDNNIQLISDDRPIEHNRIIEEIKKADIALLPYKIDANLKGRIPTKIYEYIAYNLPMLTPENSGWGELIQPINAGLTANFNNRKAKPILDDLQKMTFYTKSSSNHIFWESEEDKLLSTIKMFI
jgi:hypothetical protein